MHHPRMNRMKILKTLALVSISIVTNAPADEVDETGIGPSILRRADRVAFIGDALADMLRRDGYVETELVRRAPQLELTFRNLGWSGDTLRRQPRPLNFGGLDEHLRRQQVDVVIACFGMSASLDDPDGAEDFARELAGLVRHLRSQSYNGDSSPRVVLVTPIARESSGAAGDAKSREEAAHHADSLAAYAAAVRAVAKNESTPVVDLHSAVRERIEESASQPMTDNGIHLNAYGYWAVGFNLTDALMGPAPVWRYTLDVQADRADGPSGVHAVEVDRSSRDVWRVRWNVTAFPQAAPPTDSRVHRSLAAGQPTLTVKGLGDGDYELRIGETTIRRANADAWRAGLVIDGLPSQRHVEQLREQINDKNAMFFYRWRPSNAEYVFGRRTKPFGSVSFPPEMREFDRLIDEADKSIVEAAAKRLDETWTFRRVLP